MKLWKDIEGWEDIYKISRTGKVKSLPRRCPSKNGGTKPVVGGFLNPKIDRYGYKVLCLSKPGVKKHTSVHRLVALAFIPNPENKPCVNHKDGNKQNNHYKNLEWCTVLENNLHAIKNKLIVGRKGVKHHNCKLTEDNIKLMKLLYGGRNKGMTMSDLAIIFDVSIGQISRIINNQRWINH